MSKWAKYYTVGLLTLTSMFLYADQNLISPNLSAVAEDFGFDEREKAGTKPFTHVSYEPALSRVRLVSLRYYCVKTIHNHHGHTAVAPQVEQVSQPTNG